MPEVRDLDDALIDAGVGANIRLHRRALGLSQSTLAKRIGVTFQQVQKYENGTNRISASKLHHIALALEVEITELFGSYEASAKRHDCSAQYDDIVTFISTAEGRMLNEAFLAIGDGLLRRKIVELVNTIAN